MVQHWTRSKHWRYPLTPNTLQHLPKHWHYHFPSLVLQPEVIWSWGSDPPGLDHIYIYILYLRVALAPMHPGSDPPATAYWCSSHIGHRFCEDGLLWMQWHASKTERFAICYYERQFRYISHTYCSSSLSATPPSPRCGLNNVVNIPCNTAISLLVGLDRR